MRRLPEKWMVVFTILLGTFTIILNNSMLHPALPKLVTIIETNAASTAWVMKFGVRSYL